MPGLEFTFFVEPTKTGFSTFEASRGIISVADTLEGIQQNALEATLLYYEDTQERIEPEMFTFKWYESGETIDALT
jgi:hypothetical protein